MESGSIERIKNATFSHAVRGYDRQEVDAFLSEVAGWLERGGDEEAGSEAVRARLERVGEQTAAILTEAHDAAEAIREDASAEVRQGLVEANATSERLRAEADEYAETARTEADAYALKTRNEADGYAAETREQAEADAARTREEADREAQRIVGEANRRRRDVEAVIGDLEERREAVVAELERLASGLAGTATEHRGARSAPPEIVAMPTQEVDTDPEAGQEPVEREPDRGAVSEAETQEHSMGPRSA